MSTIIIGGSVRQIIDILDENPEFDIVDIIKKNEL